MSLTIETSHLIPDGKFFQLSGPCPPWVAERVRELIDDWRESAIVAQKKTYH